MQTNFRNNSQTGWCNGERSERNETRYSYV